MQISVIHKDRREPGLCASKICLIMRLTVLFLTVVLVQASAGGYAQNRVTLSGKNVPIESIFKYFREQTGYDFLYSNSVVYASHPVSIHLKDAPLHEALNLCLEDQPLTYHIINKTVVVEVDHHKALKAAPDQSEVSGTVTNEKGDPLVGVSVQVKGTAKGTVTNASGQYRIEGAPAQDTLIFSIIGYKEKEIPINGRTLIDVRLSQSISKLNQLVVVGYGKQKREDVTGAISSINATKLDDRNPESVQDLLRANIPGLAVGFSAGAKPGGSLEIRGPNSLSAGTSPLIVVDGTVYDGSLSDINPMDIASIDVLKDASAAAVYGASGANGVIVVTTKSGEKGKPVIHFNTNLSLATMEVNQPIYQGKAFVKWRTDVFNSMAGFNEKPYEYNDPRKLPSNISLQQWLAYDGSQGDPVAVWLRRLNFFPIEIKDYKLGRTFNWYDFVFHNGFQQNYNISLSGGSDQFNYYWSGRYMHNNGIIVDDKYSTVQSRLKLEGKITHFLTVGVNTQFSKRNESAIPYDWTNMLRASPYGSFYNDDSTSLRPVPQDNASSGARNPLYDVKHQSRLTDYYTLRSNIYAIVRLPFNIKYRVNFTPRLAWNRSFNHVFSNDVGTSAFNKGGTASRDLSSSYQWQVDNILKWDKTFNEVHHFKLTLLQHSGKYQSWVTNTSNEGFQPNDNLGFHSLGNGINPIISSDDQYWTEASLMGRLFYSFKSRYLLTLSFRRDGYSAFGQNHPFGNFPGVAAGWIFTDEPFFRADWLSFGKLRLSYGVNGNKNIGTYTALADVNNGQYIHVSPNGNVEQVPEVYVTSLGNPNLKWERTTQFDMGLDFDIKNNLLGGSIDFYKSKTNNLLVQRRLSDVTGFNYIWTNLGQVNNWGFEVSLYSHNIERKNFTWTSSATFSLNRNKIVHLYGGKVPVKNAAGKIKYVEPSDTLNHWFIGHSLDAIWDLKVKGVYQTGDSALAARYGQSPGDFKLQDVNDDGNYTNADRHFLGHSTPRFRWSFTNNFTYKHLTLSFMIYSLWGQMKAFNEAKNRVNLFPNKENGYVFPYWTPEHATNSFTRIYSSDGGASYNVYRKGSFIRLRNVTLAYTLPRSMLQRANIKKLKFYFTVKNAAFYAPDWIFWDPENSGPTPRIYTLGIDLTL